MRLRNATSTPSTSAETRTSQTCDVNPAEPAPPPPRPPGPRVSDGPAGPAARRAAGPRPGSATRLPTRRGPAVFTLTRPGTGSAATCGARVAIVAGSTPRTRSGPARGAVAPHSPHDLERDRVRQRQRAGQPKERVPARDTRRRERIEVEPRLRVLDLDREGARGQLDPRLRPPRPTPRRDGRPRARPACPDATRPGPTPPPPGPAPAPAWRRPHARRGPEARAGRPASA